MDMKAIKASKPSFLEKDSLFIKASADENTRENRLYLNIFYSCDVKPQ